MDDASGHKHHETTTTTEAPSRTTHDPPFGAHLRRFDTLAHPVAGAYQKDKAILPIKHV